MGVTGASGAIYPLRLLEKLQGTGAEIHLILSRSGEKTLFLETGKRAVDLKSLANHAWPVDDISAPLASGSFRTDGMIVSPCSIHTMSSIAHGITSNLLTRAADVTLKERRPLDFDDTGESVSSGSSENHDGAGGNGCDSGAADSGILQSARDDRGSGRFKRRPRPRSDRFARREKARRWNGPKRKGEA